LIALVNLKSFVLSTNSPKPHGNLVTRMKTRGLHRAVAERKT